MICNKHIEIHMELVSKIQSLREEYEKRLERYNKYLYESSEKSYSYWYEQARVNMARDIIHDLEELLK